MPRKCLFDIRTKQFLAARFFFILQIRYVSLVEEKYSCAKKKSCGKEKITVTAIKTFSSHQKTSLCL